jgi:hypothetical protein
MNNKFDMDVVVIGGGVAGASAAITAARSGLRTLLLESQITLGGLATNGYVSGVAGMLEGNCREWLDLMKAGGDLIDRPHGPAFDPEKAKLYLENMLISANARILYGVYATDVVTENNCIKEVICHCKSGRMPVSSRIFIDSTGDADVASYAGVPYDVGSPQFAGLNMSSTLSFRMANVNMRKYSQARQEWTDKENAAYGKPRKMNILVDLEEQAVKNGDLPSFVFPTALIYQVPNTSEDDADITIGTTHSFYNHNTDVEDLTRQVLEQHQQMLAMEKFLRKYVPGFEKSRITGLASVQGVRDSRRIVGEYILKNEDVVCAKKFEDGIARFPEFLDTHHPTSARLGFSRHVHLKEPKAPAVCRPAQCTGEMHPFGNPGGYEARVNPTEYCEIPYRSLVPLKIDNLMVTGRSVSADFDAIAAVRVIAPAMGTGQAAAIAASMCIKDKITPRQVDGKAVRQTMIGQGVPLNEVPGGYWAEGRKDFSGEFVVTAGDFAAAVKNKKH